MTLTADRELYERFFDAFALEGEPNIPIDRQIMQSPEFYHLLERLRQHAELHQRDHWSAKLSTTDPPTCSSPTGPPPCPSTHHHLAASPMQGPALVFIPCSSLLPFLFCHWDTQFQVCDSRL